MATAGWRIGELAARARVSADTIRTTERLGLRLTAHRGENGYRRYQAPAVQRLLRSGTRGGAASRSRSSRDSSACARKARRRPRGSRDGVGQARRARTRDPRASITARRCARCWATGTRALANYRIGTAWPCSNHWPTPSSTTTSTRDAGLHARPRPQLPPQEGDHDEETAIDDDVAADVW